MEPIFLFQSSMSTTRKINLWSSPRNVSTALMYSFAQRPDTTVVDEPLYAHYLTHTKSKTEHPGHEAILKSQSSDGNEVVRDIILGSYATPVVIFKQMTHHLIELQHDFLSQTDNVLLIRDPRAIISSYAKVIPNPDINDIGVAKQMELFEELNRRGTLRAIVDAKQLLLNPAKVLEELCHRLSIPWTPAMLSWKAGPRPEDGVWAPHWYHSVHGSTGFRKKEDRPIILPPELESLAEQCKPYYERLLNESIKA